MIATRKKQELNNKLINKYKDVFKSNIHTSNLVPSLRGFDIVNYAVYFTQEIKRIKR